MKNIFKVTLTALLTFVLAVSCSHNKEEDTPSQIPVKWYPNPNGDSELALFMRDMYEEALYVKQQVELGKPANIKLDHEKILTAHATEPEKAASDEYKAFAGVYLQTIKALKKANAEDLPDMYMNLVASCSTCHEALCPGPLEKIAKLK
jgi:cytochrome c553